jgi:HEAT repeat protein
MSAPDSSPADPPSPRTLSQPAPGMGSYAMRDQGAEVVNAAEAPSAPQPAATRSARPDPRHTDGDATHAHEIVKLPSELKPASSTTKDELQPPALDPSLEAERLVEALSRAALDEEGKIVASLLELGELALPVLKRRFPGPLWLDRQQPRQRMPRGRDLSAIARALFAFEQRAVPVILELLAAPKVDVRLGATTLAADRACPELLWPLFERVFDADGQVRLAAFEALPAFRAFEGFAELKKRLRDKAGDERESIASRASALEAISVLRDPRSVELLVKVSAHANRQLSVSAHRSLVAITAQDFGDSARKWKNWLEKNARRARAEWLIDALMHSDERLRNVAGVELQKLTQIYYGFAPAADKRERERIQGRYREWWQRTGRRQFRE